MTLAKPYSSTTRTWRLRSCDLATGRCSTHIAAAPSKAKLSSTADCKPDYDPRTPRPQTEILEPKAKSETEPRRLQLIRLLIFGSAHRFQNCSRSCTCQTQSGFRVWGFGFSLGFEVLGLGIIIIIFVFYQIKEILTIPMHGLGSRDMYLRTLLYQAIRCRTQ